mmetsp:Transcript_4363/g.8025  ORF Transcript_4363/g.8025 Transcript_4363/m.8025 type:complete len:497 (-) Transcript_4363:176-1666(-)
MAEPPSQASASAGNVVPSADEVEGTSTLAPDAVPSSTENAEEEPLGVTEDTNALDYDGSDGSSGSSKNVPGDVQKDEQSEQKRNKFVDPISLAAKSAKTASKLAASSAKTATKAAVSTAKTATSIFSSDEHTYDELKKIEKTRREILDRCHLPFYRILTFWKGTVLSSLANDPLMWIMVLIYVMVRIAARFSIPDFVHTLGGADIGVIGAFLSFFLVFYVNHSNKRFDILYNTSTSCQGRIFDMGALCKAYLPRENALRLLRYMNAAHIAAYVGFSDTYNYQNYFVEENKLQQLLTDKEVERMQRIGMDSGGTCTRELITWCIHEVRKAEKQGYIDSRLATQMRELILRLRAKIGTIYDYHSQPVPFFYVHFVCLLSVMYLPLFSLQAGLSAGTGDEAYWATDIISGLIVILQGVYVIGLRVISDKLSDPYGDDYEDIGIMTLVDSGWLMSRRMIEGEIPEHLEDLNAQLEEELVRKETHIGDAFMPRFDEDDLEK